RGGARAGGAEERNGELDRADAIRDSADAAYGVQPREERAVRNERLESGRFGRGELERAEEQDYRDQAVAQHGTGRAVEALGKRGSGDERKRRATKHGNGCGRGAEGTDCEGNGHSH